MLIDCGHVVENVHRDYECVFVRLESLRSSHGAHDSSMVWQIRRNKSCSPTPRTSIVHETQVVQCADSFRFGRTASGHRTTMMFDDNSCSKHIKLFIRRMSKRNGVIIIMSFAESIVFMLQRAYEINAQRIQWTKHAFLRQKKNLKMPQHLLAFNAYNFEVGKRIFSLAEETPPFNYDLV